jgi:hypothetical protein
LANHIDPEGLKRELEGEQCGWNDMFLTIHARLTVYRAIAPAANGAKARIGGSRRTWKRAFAAPASIRSKNSGLRGQDANDSANELSAVHYPTKEKALAVLRSSATEVAAALREHRGDMRPKSMEVVVTFLEHTSEHHGPLVVYGRLMGIVPPPSRM